MFSNDIILSFSTKSDIFLPHTRLIMGSTEWPMEVYVEYAVAENFLLDLLLLFLAVKCARAETGAFRLLLAAAVGAAEAIVFPLLPLPAWAAYLVKFLGGAILPLLAVKKGTKRTYFFVFLSFFALTFALGGLLTAVYSFFDLPYAEGQGYLVESAPVGLVLGLAGLFGVGVFYLSRSFYRYRKLKSSIFAVELCHNGRTLSLKALADTGNSLFFRGEPVNVLSPTAALLLFREEPAPYGRIAIGTVNGSSERPVFACNLLKIGAKTYQNALFTTGDVKSKEYQIILHPSYSEENHEAVGSSAQLVAEDKR